MVLHRAIVNSGEKRAASIHRHLGGSRRTEDNTDLKIRRFTQRGPTSRDYSLDLAGDLLQRTGTC